MIFMCPKTFSKDILHEYVPQEYLREIVQAKNSSGMLFLYYALLADLKPMLDDWVPAENMHLFDFRFSSDHYSTIEILCFSSFLIR